MDNRKVNKAEGAAYQKGHLPQPGKKLDKIVGEESFDTKMQEASKNPPTKIDPGHVGSLVYNTTMSEGEREAKVESYDPKEGKVGLRYTHNNILVIISMDDYKTSTYADKKPNDSI